MDVDPFCQIGIGSMDQIVGQGSIVQNLCTLLYDVQGELCPLNL